MQVDYERGRRVVGGTGYRVRREEKEKEKRLVLDVGYTDRKKYKRKKGYNAKTGRKNVQVDYERGRRVVGGKGELGRRPQTMRKSVDEVKSVWPK